MKLIILVTVTIALTSAATVDNKYDIHYSQHQSSVDNARSSMNEQLSKLESQSRLYSSGGSENYVAGCSSCGSSAYNSRLSGSSSALNSRSSSSGVGSDYVGVGIVGHTSDGVLSRSRFSSSAHEQDDMQQRVVPGDLNVIQASAYRQAETEDDEDDVQRTVGVGFHDGIVNNDRYSYSQRRQQEESERIENQRVGGTRRVVPVYYVPSDSSTSSSQRIASASELERHEERRGGAVPINNYVSMAVRPGTATVLQVPVRVNYVPPSTDQYVAGRSQYNAATGSETNSRVNSGYRANIYPATSYTSSLSDRSELENSRNSGVHSENYNSGDLNNYNSFSSRNSASQTHEEDSQVQERVSPIIDSSSSRHSSTIRGGGFTGVRVVPAFPVNTIESTSSQRSTEEREQRRYSAARPTYVTEDRNRANYGTSSRTSGIESSSQLAGTSGTTYYPSSSRNSQSQNQYQSQQHGSSSQTQHQSGSAAQTQYQAGSGSQSQQQGGSSYLRTGYGGYPRPSASNAIVSSRFGSGVMSSNSDDLLQYMSESERLAKLQQQQIANSARSSQVLSSVDEANRRTINSAQHLDAAAASFVGSSNLANRASELDTVETIPGGSNFQRVKSWSKQSKWASGSEYDSDGKIKSHSMLSTAEAEKHNLNGKEAGYKAATTTLENDGKVSTYSIHTP